MKRHIAGYIFSPLLKFQVHSPSHTTSWEKEIISNQGNNSSLREVQNMSNVSYRGLGFFFFPIEETNTKISF